MKQQPTAVSAVFDSANLTGQQLATDWKASVEYPPLSSPDRRINPSKLPAPFQEIFEKMSAAAATGKDVIVLGLKNAGYPNRAVLTYLLQCVQPAEAFADYKICLPENYWKAAGRYLQGYSLEVALNQKRECQLQDLADGLRAFTQSQPGAEMPGKFIVLLPSDGAFDRAAEKTEFIDRLQRGFSTERRATILHDDKNFGESFESGIKKGLLDANIEGLTSLILRASQNPSNLSSEIRGSQYSQAFHLNNLERHQQQYPALLRCFQLALWAPYPIHVIIHGPHGTGKTSLLKALAQTAREVGADYDYLSFFDDRGSCSDHRQDDQNKGLLRARSETIGSSSNSTTRPIIFVDQIDLAQNNSRYSRLLVPGSATFPGNGNGHGLPRRGHVFATSNLSPEELDDRIPQYDHEFAGRCGLEIGWNTLYPYGARNPAAPIEEFAIKESLDDGALCFSIDFTHRWSNDSALAEL